jgi:hypothetical protein
MWLGERVAVQIKRSRIPATVLFPHETRKTTPNIEGRFFDVLVCMNDKFADQFRQPEPPQISRDAWKMRDSFLGLEHDPQSLCEFLNKWGLWSFEYGYKIEILRKIGDPRPPQPPHQFVLEFPERLWKAAESYKRALLPRSSTRWLKDCEALEFTRMETPPFFAVERSYIDETIAVTITIDHMRKARFGICKRCSRLFEHETQHRQQFCSRHCASAAAVKRWREKRKKEAAKEAKGKKTSTHSARPK